MLPNFNPVVQTLLGTLFTWGLTAIGSSLILVFSGTQRKLLDGSLGFSSGVMIAASYWSLLAPAIELAGQDSTYGNDGQFSFIPALVGFVFGAFFVYLSDLIISLYEMDVLNILIPEANQCSKKKFKCDSNTERTYYKDNQQSIGITDEISDARQRCYKSTHPPPEYTEIECDNDVKACSWKRILLLIIAITVHNIPEGLAVGIAFGAVDSSPSSTFNSASYIVATTCCSETRTAVCTHLTALLVPATSNYTVGSPSRCSGGDAKPFSRPDSTHFCLSFRFVFVFVFFLVLQTIDIIKHNSSRKHVDTRAHNKRAAASPIKRQRRRRRPIHTRTLTPRARDDSIPSATDLGTRRTA